MKSSKRKKIITGSIVMIVVSVVGGLFTADYAVSRVMDLFVAGIEAESNDVSRSDKSLITEPKESSSSIASEDGEIAAQGVNKQHTPLPSAESKTQDEDSDRTKTNPNNATGQEKSIVVAQGKPGGIVTKEQVSNVREKLTVSDKASVVKVVLKNLSLADMKRMQAMAEGGLTLEEKKDTKQMLLGKLSSDEYNELSALAKKYGISRGRSYEEAQKENP